MMKSRPATSDDAEAIAQVHVAAWRESYRDLLPKSVLDGLSVHRRITAWSEIISRAPSEIVYVTEDDGAVVGFAHGGVCSAELAQEMEVFSIYLIDRAKRAGRGRALMGHLGSEFASRGAKSVGLWVMRDNPGARRFYEKYGGRVALERTEHRDGYDVAEVGYIWHQFPSAWPKPIAI